MTIACLGWGSLIWDARELPIVGKWQGDGPALPLEFCRKSLNGRITLVICPEAAAIPVLWATMNVASLDEACLALAAREDMTGKNAIARNVGRWSVGQPPEHPGGAAIGNWATEKGIDAVVWTALSPKFENSADVPTADAIVAYLQALDGKKRGLAEEYVRRAPAQIATQYRARIEQELGWTPTG